MTDPRKRLWECPKCHQHFFQYVIDEGTPVCGIGDKACPAKIAATLNRDRERDITS